MRNRMTGRQLIELPLIFHQCFEQIVSTVAPDNIINVDSKVQNIIQEVTDNGVTFVFGDNGNGRSTVLRKIYGKLISEPNRCLYINTVNPVCKLAQVWNYFGQLANECGEKQLGKILFLESAGKQTKDSALVEFLKKKFDWLLIDNSNRWEPHILGHLIDWIRGSATKLIVVSTKHAISKISHPEKIPVYPIPEWATYEWLQWISHRLVGTDGVPMITITEDTLPHNLKFVEILCTLIKVCGLIKAEEVLQVIKDGEGHNLNALVRTILKMLFDENVLSQLCAVNVARHHLPLPRSTQLEQLRQLGLINVHTGNSDGDFITVSLPDCVRHCFESIVGENILKHHQEAHKSWMNVLSPKLMTLFSAALKQSWAFVPETWQYAEFVGEEEMVNLRDLIMANNKQLPQVAERQVILQALYHSLLGEDFSVAAALLFVIVRFMYTFGSASDALIIADYINEKSPETSVAPQLVIRKARVMKDTGDLLGAERILEEILDEKTEKQRWQYKQDYDYTLVQAVCVQIKGYIQHNLGLWQSAGHLIIESIIGFNSIRPKPDKKGISSSLGILGAIFRNMSPTEFFELKKMYTVNENHPLLAAYCALLQGSSLARYTPLFYTKHMRAAGEVLLLYSNILPSQYQTGYISVAIQNLKNALQAHRAFESLTSREQFIEFVSALHQLSLAYEKVHKTSSHFLKTLEEVSISLYEHFCASKSSSLQFDEETREKMNTALTLLGLSALVDTESQLSGPLICVKLAEQNQHEYVYPTKVLRTEDSTHISQGVRVNQSESKIPAGGTMGGVTKRMETLTVTSKVDKEEEFEHGSSSEGTEKNSSDINRSKLPRSSQDAGPSSSNDTSPFISSSSSSDSSSSFYFESVDMTSVDETLDFLAATVGTMDGIREADEACPPGVLPVPLPKPISSKVKRALVHKYDPKHNVWTYQPSLAYIGNELTVDKKGKFRDVFEVMYLHQEELLGRYVGKRYREQSSNLPNYASIIAKYKCDVLNQVTARYYVTLFNQSLLSHKDIQTQIQFLPAIHLQLLDNSGYVIDCINVEPYAKGEFVKFTNNYLYVNKNLPEDELALATAYSHFTFNMSGGELLIVDLQGWKPVETKGYFILTDPQIHSVKHPQFGTSHWGQKGFNAFWEKQHPHCNAICKKLGLQRPEQM